MSTFEPPLGYSFDFNGTTVGNELHQAGGAQNVIDNDPNASPFVAFPSGEPVGNVAHGAGVVLHQGTFTIPAGTTDGTYTLQIIANSLFVRVLDAPPAAGPDPVIAVDANVGASLTFSVLKDVVAPVLLHQPAEGPQGSPCTGYIDPRFDSSNGIDVDLCFTAWNGSAYIPEEIVMVFSEQVRNIGAGGGTSLTAAAFTVAVTGGVARGVASVNDVMVGNDHVVTITLDGPIPVQEWTTITAGVEDLAGNAIASSGNEGPGVVESDRIDIGCLPGDVNQSGNTSPLDLIRLKQKIEGTCSGEESCPECSGLLLGYDIDRKGAFSPLDLIRMKQLMLFTGNATRVWNGQLMTSAQP